MTHYAKSIEFEPSYVFGHVHLGTCLQLERDMQGALEQYKKVVSLTEDDISHYAEVRHAIFVNMATAYLGVKDLNGARESLESAIRLSPDNPQEWTMLGFTEQQTGNADRAIWAFSQALKLQPSRRRFQLLAQALQQAGRQQEAQAAVRQALQLPANPTP